MVKIKTLQPGTKITLESTAFPGTWIVRGESSVSDSIWIDHIHGGFCGALSPNTLVSVEK